MAANQYNDLPMIPSSMDTFNYNAYGTEHLRHATACEYHYEIAMSNEEYVLSDAYEHGMAIDRYLQDPYAVTTSMLQANAPVQPMDHHYGLQYSSLDYHRQVSPCSSGRSSDPSLGELQSPHAYYPSYGSPEEFFSHVTASYPTTERFQDEGYMSQPPIQGGCSLRQLEYTHPEPISEEIVDAEMKEEAPVEPVQISTKVEATPDDTQDDADSGIGNSVRDAESVQPIDMEQDTASDSDYSPKSRGSGKRRRSSASSPSKVTKRRNSSRKDSIASNSSSSARGTRKVHKANNTNKAPVDPTDDRRAFPCTLANYGCSSTFTSKNEWKRHMSTQHIKLGYWRCDLCPPSVDQHDDSVRYYNDFNRKDLFTQHLRRMHAVASRTGGQKSQATNDDVLTEHQTRCREQLRKPPQQSACLFCDMEFEGPTSWEERMEHVGKHLEKDRKTLPNMLDDATWIEDKNLETYLLEEGLIAREGAHWKIGDGKPIRHVKEETDSEED